MAESRSIGGLTLRGQFVSLTPRSFAGSDGAPVNLQVLKVHDPVAFSYHEINAIGDDALVLANALAGVQQGTEIVVSLDVTKSGKLKPLNVAVV